MVKQSQSSLVSGTVLLKIFFLTALLDYNKLSQIYISLNTFSFGAFAWTGTSWYIPSYFIINFCIFHFKIHQNSVIYSPCCWQLSNPQSTRIVQRLFIGSISKVPPLSCRESFSMLSCLHCWTICLDREYAGM